MPLTIESIKKLFQDIVVPELREIRIEIKRLDEKIESVRAEMHSEIKRLDEKIDFLRTEMHDKFDSLRTEIDSLRTELRDKFDTVLDVRERLAALESKVGIFSVARDKDKK